MTGHGEDQESSGEHEFDTLAAWTAEAVEELGESHALPAACQGSGSPAALGWLADRMGLHAGVRLLDSGAGIGGPAELVAGTHGVEPVLAEPMLGACRAAARLFGRPVVATDGAALPFADHAFDAVWCLAVLSTADDQGGLLGELARIVTPGGPVGLLVFVRTTALADQPEGNDFPDDHRLDTLLGAAGLEVQDRAVLDDFDTAPRSWQRAVSAVEDLLESRHGDDPRWRSSQEGKAAVSALIDDGRVVGRLLACRCVVPRG